VSLLPAEFFGGEAGTFTPIKFGQKYSSSATVNATQLLFDGSYIVGTMAAKVFVQLTKDQKEKTEIEIRDAVAQAYYLVLVAQDNLKTIQENLEVTETTLKETKAFYENGFKEELDVDQVRLMKKTSQNQLADAKRQIKVARTLLKFSMGMDIDNSINLKDNLDQFVNPIRLKQSENVDYNVSNHIDYRIMDTQLKAQKLVLRNEQVKFLPKVSAFYNYGKNTSTDLSNVFDREVPWFTSSMIGLKLSLPIFTSFQRTSKIKQEKINFHKLENEMLMTQQNLKKEITISYTNLMNAKEKYENDLEGLEIAKRIYDRTRIKFNEGISSSTELSQNEQQYLNSHATYISSTLELLKAKINFDKALGNL
jgi:outer membrane protein TolC